MTELTDTQKIAANARLIADVLDTFPLQVEAPTHHHIEQYLDKPQLAWLLFSSRSLDEQKARAQAVIQALGGTWDKSPGELFRFTCLCRGVELEVVVQREAVCRRVVTGTREVTKTVPITQEIGHEEITETVEDFEWVCSPLLLDVTR